MLSAAALQPARAPDPPAVQVLLVEPAAEPHQAVWGDMDSLRQPRAPAGAPPVQLHGVAAREHGYRECVLCQEALAIELTRLDSEEVIRGLKGRLVSLYIYSLSAFPSSSCSLLPPFTQTSQAI